MQCSNLIVTSKFNVHHIKSIGLKKRKLSPYDRADVFFFGSKKENFISFLSTEIQSNLLSADNHCVKSVQVRSYVLSVFSYGPEITP